MSGGSCGALARLARCRIVSNYEKVRRGDLSGVYTVREMAAHLNIHPSWIYRQIGVGTITIEKDARFGRYLFPCKKDSVIRMNQLKKGELRHVSFQKVHCSG